MKKEQNVLERVYEPGRLLEAWRQVKRNAGAAGVDQMTVAEFERRKEELFPLIRGKLIAGTYRFKPARRVSIPKEGTPGKFRNLGIPVVMDRIVAQSVHATLDEIYDSGFSPGNFGFRKGRSQHEAIRYVRETVKQGHRWCASVDLKSYFDEIPHNLVFKLIRRRIADERLVTLIARALKAGVVVEGKLEKTTKGVPQGSPLSPILSNIVLNEMDQELDRRGLTYARWADDFVILLKSPRSAQRVMQRITRYLEETLGLPVNREKSEAALMREVTFLGFRIYRHKIRVSDQAIARFKRRVHALTHRNNPKSMQKIIEELNLFLRGWANYFRIQEFKTQFGSLDDWVRGRLRSMQLAKWKKPKKFQRAMIHAGVPVWRARRIWVAMRSWQSASRREVLRVLRRRLLSEAWDWCSCTTIRRHRPADMEVDPGRRSKSGLPGRYEPFRWEGVVERPPPTRSGTGCAGRPIQSIPPPYQESFHQVSDLLGEILRNRPFFPMQQPKLAPSLQRASVTEKGYGSRCSR